MSRLLGPRPWIALAVALAALCTPALAEEEPPLGTWIFAKPIARKNPSYPMSAVQQWKEGWVLVSFCIDATGSVHSAVIERSSGVPEFERAALRTIPKWKYEPARLNGEPTEACDVNVRLSFSMQGIGLGARREFVKQWKKASQLIDEAKLAEAKAVLDAIKPHNNYESGRLALARSRIASSTGDRKQQLADLRMALLQPKAIEPRLRRDVRRQVFALEIQQREWASAYETYGDLADDAEALSEPEKNAGAQLSSLIASDETLSTDGELECRCDKSNGDPLWSARLLRREFSFAEASGKIDRFDLLCEKRRFRATFQTGTAWRVPESWGKCTLYVFGEEGAKFKLVEMAPQIAAAEAAPPAGKSQP
jgi:TonB family protein